MKPISYKRRLVYFVTLVVIFVISIPFLVIYSLGYGIGDAFSFIKTGGVYVRTDMSNVSLFVDDEFVENSNFLSRSIFVQKLSLGEHAVRTEREGYHTWRKQLMVYPNKVTEAEVLMLPVEIPFTVVNATTTARVYDLETGTTSDVVIDSPNYIDLYEEFFATTTDIFTATTSLSATATTTPIYVPHHYADLFESVHIATSTHADVTYVDSGDMVVWQYNGVLYAGWNGRNDTIPPLFCDDSVCNTIIEVHRDFDVIDFAFMPGRSETLVIQTSDGIVATQIDDRGGIVTQPIFEKLGATFEIIDSNIVVFYNGVFYVWEV